MRGSFFTYYEDVQRQANQSFSSAKAVAHVGFWVLISTLAYALVFDALNRFNYVGLSAKESSLTVAVVGVVSGVLIEFIAGVNFWLYSQCSRQFGAFHICLERTHRYLLAYKISEEIKDRRDETLSKLVCIMANATMITVSEIDSNKPEEAQSNKRAAAGDER